MYTSYVYTMFYIIKIVLILK